MATVVIKEDSTQAKAIIAMLKAFDFVEFINEEKEKTIYNPDIVKKLEQAKQEIKEGKTRSINPDDVWGSLGLK